MIPPAAPEYESASGIPTRYRVGSVPYLNALPLTAGLERDLLLEPPSRLALDLQEQRLDAALVSTSEVLFSDRLRALDGYGIVSRGPVFSVFLAHRTPIDRLRRIHVDPASCTSVNLLRVLLQSRNVRPEFVPLSDYGTAASLEDVLLIGNPAIQFRRRPQVHQIWDLGAAWQELTGLPFVYAVWAVRDGVDPGPLVRALVRTAESGLSRIPALVEASSEFDPEFRRAYVGGHIQYRIDEAARQGVRRFQERLQQIPGRTVHPVRWIPTATGDAARIT